MAEPLGNSEHLKGWGDNVQAGIVDGKIIERDPNVDILNVEPSGIPGVMQASAEPRNVPLPFFLMVCRQAPPGYSVRVEKGLVYLDHPVKKTLLCVPTLS